MIFSLLLYSCLATVNADGIAVPLQQNCRVHQVNVERMGLGECSMAGPVESAKYWEENLHTRIVVRFACTDRPQRYLHANEA